MTLTFHVIYVPGSVRCQLFFVESLLRWSDCNYRLVANGCTEEEINQMKACCSRSPRLDFLQIPTNRPLIHHDALNYLQARCRSDTFCILDSDILAAGPFMEILFPSLSTHAGVFAGAPLWCRPQDQVFHPSMDVVCGEHNRTAGGLPLGGTFLAIYNNTILTEYIHSTGMGFEMRSWSRLPLSLRSWCAAHDLAGPRHFYDTGKALNIGLLEQGNALAVFDSPALYHLGGLSFIARRNWTYAQGSFLSGLAPRLGRAYTELRWWMRNDPVNRSRKLPFGRRRRLYGPYFSRLLAALADGKPLPPLPAEDDPDVRRLALDATRQILSLAQADGLPC